MPVSLVTSRNVPAEGPGVPWAAVATPWRGDPATRKTAGGDLEAAFEAIVPEWLELCRRLGTNASAALAHMPNCAPNASDFGEMLAWRRLVGQWAAEPDTTVVVCDDPWVFRALATLGGVEAGQTPRLVPQWIKLRLRGLAARWRVTFRVAWRFLKARKSPNRPSAVLIVRGHPGSTPQDDAYFPELMARLPELGRMLHVDTSDDLADALCDANGRTGCLDAWGTIPGLLAMPFARWSVKQEATDKTGTGWLVARAVAVEGGGGQAAMSRWQHICQRRWLAQTKPSKVVMAWEHHGWQRDLVRVCRHLDIATIGYQHTVVSRHLVNFHPDSAPDGLEAVPDMVVCNGSAARDIFRAWNFPASRLRMGGALRMPPPSAPVHVEPDAPIYIPLPFKAETAHALLAAATKAVDQGWRFVVKTHPLYPVPVPTSPAITRTTTPLGEMSSVAGVVFANTAVGLEALLMGIPVLRFQPGDHIAYNILPDSVDVPLADDRSLATALSTMTIPEKVDRNSVFSPPDFVLWQDIMAT